jgi:hypothetical protein
VRLLAKRHTDVARWRTKLCCRLHALVSELVPGGISKEVVVNQAQALIDGLQPDGVAAVERHRQALELVAEIEHLDIVRSDCRARIVAAVEASATTLTEIFGVGPVVAAMLIGATAATRCGSAPPTVTPPTPAPLQSNFPLAAASPIDCRGAATAA